MKMPLKPILLLTTLLTFATPAVAEDEVPAVRTIAPELQQEIQSIFASVLPG